jgi:ribonuclease G
MYNEDDAVAKLDGYVISVFGAASLVGERTLVRIEKVGRSAAQASMVDPPEGVATPSSSEPAGDGRRRRRGRRGGRGRRKKAEPASS